MKSPYKIYPEGTEPAVILFDLHVEHMEALQKGEGLPATVTDNPEFQQARNMLIHIIHILTEAAVEMREHMKPHDQSWHRDERQQVLESVMKKLSAEDLVHMETISADSPIIQARANAENN